MCPTKIGVAETIDATSAAAHENDKAYNRMTGLPVLLSLLCLVVSVENARGRLLLLQLYRILAPVQERLFDRATFLATKTARMVQIVLSDQATAKLGSVIGEKVRRGPLSPCPRKSCCGCRRG